LRQDLDGHGTTLVKDRDRKIDDHGKYVMKEINTLSSKKSTCTKC